MRNHIVVCTDPSDHQDEYHFGVLVQHDGRHRFTYDEAKACVDEMRGLFAKPCTYTILCVQEVAG